MTSQHPIRAAIENNELQACAITGCQKQRSKLSRHCVAHAQRNTQWGHPRFGFAWRKLDIDHHLDAGRGFVEKNSDHKGVVAAVQWIEESLASAHRSTQQPKAHGRLTRALSHLHDHHVSPSELLSRCIATLYYAEQHRRHELEPEVLTRNLGRYALLGAPKIGPPSQQRQYGKVVGRYLFSNLKKLFAHVLVYHRRCERERAELQSALDEPFSSEGQQTRANGE